MTKAELVAKVAEKAKLTKDQAEAALGAFQCTVTTELINDGKNAFICSARSEERRVGKECRSRG